MSPGESRDLRRPRTTGQPISKLTSTGSPEMEAAASASPEDAATREALCMRAAVLEINGRSRMTKEALAVAIREREARLQADDQEQ